ALARRLKRIRPDLPIIAHHSAVEDLPLGALRCDVICACLDSRVSRIYVNEAAWRLNTPWIDAGVLASEMLARVDVFLPAPNAPCIECSWGEQHYATMEVRHPCLKGLAASTAATHAPAHLGALAASLQAAECHRLLREPPVDRAADPRAGRQVLYSLRDHQQFISQNRYNPGCRFDHRVLASQEVSARMRLKDLLFPDSGAATAGSVILSAPGRRFLQVAACPRCGRGGRAFRCISAHAAPVLVCRFCGVAAPVHPSGLHERLHACELPAWLLAHSPRALGLRPGDLFTVSDERGDRHYLLGGLDGREGR
ncbi:MAG TPA: ThiF family adenylyltransferase, partial [Chthonomonadaceae bacterium]|nr:ThiF family adenylyltransferase [Chthonomonadaceae bacterium]